MTFLELYVLFKKRRAIYVSTRSQLNNKRNTGKGGNLSQADQKETKSGGLSWNYLEWHPSNNKAKERGGIDHERITTARRWNKLVSRDQGQVQKSGGTRADSLPSFNRPADWTRLAQR